MTAAESAAGQQEREACQCLRAGPAPFQRSVSRPHSESQALVLTVKIGWRVQSESHFPSGFFFFFFLIRKCQCEWNLWVFFLCVRLVMLILLEHFSGKESSFQNNSWDRRGPWPSEVVPGCGKAHSLFPHCLLQSRAGLLTCQATTPAVGLLRNWKCVGERMERKGASILCLQAFSETNTSASPPHLAGTP